MESRIIGMIGIFGVLVGFFFFAIHLSKSMELDEELGSLKKSLVGLEQMMTHLRGQRDRLEMTSSGLMGDAKKLTTAKSRITAAQKEIASATERLTLAEQTMAELGMSARETAAGLTLPSLTLRSGKQLQQVKIKQVTFSTVSVIHSGGVAKLTLLDLPQDWVQRFLLLPPAAPKPKTPVDPTLAAADSPPGEPAPEAPAAPKTSKEVREMTLQLAKMRAQITTLRTTATNWRTVASNYVNKQYNATLMGRIGAYGPKEQSANAAAAEATRQADELEAKAAELSTLLSLES